MIGDRRKADIGEVPSKSLSFHRLVTHKEFLSNQHTNIYLLLKDLWEALRRAVAIKRKCDVQTVLENVHNRDWFRVAQIDSSVNIESSRFDDGNFNDNAKNQ